MRRLSLAALLVLVLALTTLGRGHSTPEERARVVAIAHKLEANPLDEDLRDERDWAIRWLIDAPDVSVKLCPAVLGDFMKSKYKYSSDVITQLTLSSAAFVIEHPDQAADATGQYTAGVEGVLKAYNAILASKPNAKSKSLDELLQKQSRGQLDDFVREAMKGCKPRV